MTDRILDHDTVPARLDDIRVYDGVLTRRVFAFLIDYLIVASAADPVRDPGRSCSGF